MTTAEIFSGLSRVEAARALGMSLTTLDRERKAGRIEFTMIGGSIRFRREALDAYVARRTTPARDDDRVGARPSVEAIGVGSAEHEGA